MCRGREFQLLCEDTQKAREAKDDVTQEATAKRWHTTAALNMAKSRPNVGNFGQEVILCLQSGLFGSLGKVVGRINKVNQRRARLVLGWVTVCRRVNHRGARHPGQLSLAIPLCVGAMSTSERWDVNRHTARCTRHLSVVWQCKLVSG